MKIMVAVDSFKGTLTSIEIASIIKDYYEKQKHQVISIPISDGGDGFVDAIRTFYNGELIYVNTVGPLGNPIKATYIINDEVAFLELSNVSGLNMIPKEKLNPLKTSTYGLGLVVKDAIDKGAKKIIIGLGGSATNDAGTGMLQALGVKFYENDTEIIEKMNGSLLKKVTGFDIKGLKAITKNVEFEMASDVKNPLLGTHGSVNVYAKQKGASKEMRFELEKNMAYFSNLVETYFKQVYKNETGAGAAGGFGFGARAFLNARMHRGIDYIIELLDIETCIIDSDVVFVGEGKLDHQTLFGKAPYGIAKIAKKHNKKVIGIFAINDTKIESDLFDEIYVIVPKFADQKTSIEKSAKALKTMLKEINI